MHSQLFHWIFQADSWCEQPVPSHAELFISSSSWCQNGTGVATWHFYFIKEECNLQSSWTGLVLPALYKDFIYFFFMHTLCIIGIENEINVVQPTVCVWSRNRCLCLYWESFRKTVVFLLCHLLCHLYLQTSLEPVSIR